MADAAKLGLADHLDRALAAEVSYPTGSSYVILSHGEEATCRQTNRGGFLCSHLIDAVSTYRHGGRLSVSVTLLSETWDLHIRPVCSCSSTVCPSIETEKNDIWMPYKAMTTTRLNNRTCIKEEYTGIITANTSNAGLNVSMYMYHTFEMSE